MAKSNGGLFAYYKEQPGWAKGLITIVVILVIVFMVYQAYKLIKKAIDLAKANKSLEYLKVQKKALENSGMRQSYTDIQYKLYADKLYAAMNQTGTDEEAIYAVFATMKNDVDVIKLAEAFGTQTVKSGWGQDDVTGDLSACLQSELSGGELGKVNGILRNKAIGIQF